MNFKDKITNKIKIILKNTRKKCACARIWQQKGNILKKVIFCFLKLEISGLNFFFLLGKIISNAKICIFLLEFTSDNYKQAVIFSWKINVLKDSMS